jgi:hypothetical protein
MVCTGNYAACMYRLLPHKGEVLDAQAVQWVPVSGKTCNVLQGFL